MSFLGFRNAVSIGISPHLTLGGSNLLGRLSPSLILQFAGAQTMDPRITFTRASTATYYGTQTALAEQNLLLQSQDFNVSPWTTIASTITANTVAAPDGTTTADTLTANASTNTHLASQTIGGSALVRTISVFAKKNTHDFIQLCVASDAAPFANFDLATGVVGTAGASVTSAIQDFGSGWYRCSMVFTSTASIAGDIALVSSASAPRRQSWTTTGTESVYLWGAQLEQRSAVSNYTPTTTATVTNYIPVLETAAINAPRFDYNPITQAALGLLIEEQRTNLLTYSAQFDNAAWTKTRSSITANTIVAPDGTLTGDKLVEDTTASSTHLITQNASLTIGTYTYSVYAKAGERSFLNVARNNAFIDAFSHSFNLTAGTATGTGATIVSVGNGWYRCIGTIVVNTNGSMGVNLQMSSSGGSSTYTGNGFNGLFLWGAQLEAAAFPTSYIPTVASQVTRSPDVASMTGTNFSSWYNATEGTFYGDFIPAAVAFSVLFTVSDNTSNNRILAGYTSNMLNANERVVSGGVDQANYFASFSGSLQVGQPAKLATVYNTDDFALVINNGTVATDTLGTVPVVNRLYIAANFNGTSPNSIYVRQIVYYPRRLTNSDLQALTS
jgi:hypothetical protein